MTVNRSEQLSYIKLPRLSISCSIITVRHYIILVFRVTSRMTSNVSRDMSYGVWQFVDVRVRQSVTRWRQSRRPRWSADAGRHGNVDAVTQRTRQLHPVATVVLSADATVDAQVRASRGRIVSDPLARRHSRSTSDTRRDTCLVRQRAATTDRTVDESRVGHRLRLSEDGRLLVQFFLGGGQQRRGRVVERTASTDGGPVVAIDVTAVVYTGLVVVLA